MNRPSRKRNHLIAKVENNKSRLGETKPGKRTKRYEKWIKHYEAVAAQS